MVACCDRYLDSVSLKTDETRSSTTVVGTAHGYPEKYDKGYPITLDPRPQNVNIFYAGTTLSQTSGSLEHSLLSNGGRVMAATFTATTLSDAISLAYKGISSTHFPKMHFRHEIGAKGISFDAASDRFPS